VFNNFANSRAGRASTAEMPAHNDSASISPQKSCGLGTQPARHRLFGNARGKIMKTFQSRFTPAFDHHPYLGLTEAIAQRHDATGESLHYGSVQSASGNVLSEDVSNPSSTMAASNA
jgi:hypothetical protein